jgi:hypothetical protein
VVRSRASFGSGCRAGEFTGGFPMFQPVTGRWQSVMDGRGRRQDDS